jgi:hypothetical protein
MVSKMPLKDSSQSEINQVPESVNKIEQNTTPIIQWEDKNDAEEIVIKTEIKVETSDDDTDDDSDTDDTDGDADDDDDENMDVDIPETKINNNNDVVENNNVAEDHTENIQSNNADNETDIENNKDNNNTIEENSENNDEVIEEDISKLDTGPSSARPKRKSTKAVNYKEKLETDIPSAKSEKESKRSYKLRRGKSASDSASPPPSSNSSNSSNKNISYYDVDDVVPINYQPPIDPDCDFNQIIDINSAKIDSAEVTLTLKNGVTIRKGDCIYMICEPPTEPFYIAQVLGFTKKDKTATNRKANNYMFSVCWFYRPRDLIRRLTDTRLIYASLHRDNCPLTSFRGFATVKHKSEIEDLESFRQQPDCYYFDKLYDRYMIKMYDMIPTNKLVHLPPNYYKALHKRFEFIFVEVGKADELLSSPKNCEKCLQWCSNSDSILCSSCQKSYHLLCLDPPILTKPKRGFAWYCASCNQNLEDKLAENRGTMLESSQPSQIIKAEKRALLNNFSDDNSDIQDSYNDNQDEVDSSSLRYEQLAKKFLEDDKNITLKKRRELEEWPYRYLGVHAKFEDALDIQDRPYARAASRLGSKYQCTSLTDWYDHIVQYHDTDDSSSSNNKRLKKYYNRSKKSSTPVQAEDEELENKKFPIPIEFKDVKPKDFPGWLQPKPKGYIERGGDDTSTLLWEMPKSNEENEKELGDMVENYINDCAGVAKRLNLTTVTTPNFIDAILLILMRHEYKPEECMEDVSKLTRESLKEPTFTDEEVKRFENSVRLHGSELYPVFKDVGTQTSAMVVRFYYLWKKTKNGHEIWDNFPGRAKNRLKSTKSICVDLDNPDDDGAYSNGKIKKSQVKFKCMYCETNHSPEWFRAPGAINDEENRIFEGLCYRCAELWRKYATKWENPIELIKNQEKKSTHANKRKTEYALIQEAEAVVNARENYKAHPRKSSAGLKQFKTIDVDYNYNGTVSNERSKRRASKKYTVKNSSATSSASSLTTSSTVSISAKPKVKVSKEKKESNTSSVLNRKPKRSIKEVAEFNRGEISIEEELSNKRQYKKKRQPIEKGLKFVYGKVIDDNSSGTKKLTTKRKECKQSKIETPKQAERIFALQTELASANTQLEENNTGGLFNAFLDMKLRERIEILEKELASLNKEEKKQEFVSETNNTASSPVITTPSSTRPPTKGTDTPITGRKYVRRRLYLSKTSVPGSGVFETPPIQLPSNSTINGTPHDAYDGPINLRNKFVFQMYDQNNDTAEIDYSSEFQSQPNMLPPNGLPLIQQQQQNGLSTSSAISDMTSSGINTSDILSGSSRPNSSRDVLSSRGKNGSSSQNFYNISFKGREFLNLQPSFKVKMLAPLIDFNDPITKGMISRYTSKFDVFNPLLSDDFYVSPIYQMRSSSKELHGLWKHYQASRRARIRASKLFQPLFPADKRACCVCRTLENIETMLICSNCGLNVHASCYGVKLDPKIKISVGKYNWHCDPCSNDLHPLVSTQYICLLCNSRESNMDQAIKGDPVSIPDALKRTVEGRWCHVTCSLLGENIKYGSNFLQPIYGTSIAGVSNIFQTCEICMSNGGAIATCDLCTKKAHVTCGLDFKWKLGFKMAKIFDFEDGDVVEIKGENVIGKIQPVVHCDDHNVANDLPRLYTLLQLGRKLNSSDNSYKPLIELYSWDERKNVGCLEAGLLRRKAYDEMSDAFDELAMKTSQHSQLLLENSQLTTSHKCYKCSTTSSLSWHSVDEPMGAEICHLCHNSITQRGKEYDIPYLNTVNIQNFDHSIYGC